jgi:formylglycine-generating enzyme required for sulfatase activity
MSIMTRTARAVWILSLAAGLFASDVTLTTAGILPKDGEAQYELEFWESIKNSTHAEDYEAYLKAYPEGRFAPLARSRKARYAKPEAPVISVKDMDIQYEVVTNANVRTEPSASAALKGELKRGQRVHVTGRVKDRNWYRVELDKGATGFVYGELLREPKPVPAPAATRKPTPPPAAAPLAKAKKPEPKPVQPKQPAPTPKPVAARGTGSSPLPAGGRDCDVCPEMVTLDAGSFIMGDNRGDRSERPAHRVTIGKRFAIGRTEVSVAQWNACVEAGACRAIADGADMSADSPARDLSWTDAQTYVRWLSKRTGNSYRLPSEAEWEYAARAGTTTRYWWGDNMKAGMANCKGCGGDWSNDAPVEVTALPANGFGLYGMNGGVWEWVEDCWHKSYDGAPRDGSARRSPDCRENVIRGGSWRNDKSYAHSASRFTYDSAVRYILNGFRVARTLP